MKKFKIKTNLVSGVIMGVAALLLIILLPSQVRVPTYDSGAPSPRIIPGICLGIMQGALTAGGIIGPLFGGILAEAFGMRMSFFLAAGALLLFISIAVQRKARQLHEA